MRIRGLATGNMWYIALNFDVYKEEPNVNVDIMSVKFCRHTSGCLRGLLLAWCTPFKTVTPLHARGRVSSGNCMY